MLNRVLFLQARLDEPSLPPDVLLFPETDVPLECVVGETLTKIQ